jgi:hypothetical protein
MIWLAEKLILARAVVSWIPFYLEAGYRAPNAAVAGVEKLARISRLLHRRVVCWVCTGKPEIG